MPDGYSANSVSPGHADDLFGGEIGNGVVDPAAAAVEDGADAASEGMWLTASTWLPRELLEALGRCIPGEDGTPAVTTAFCQGGPLDAMPPGPALATFLAEATSSRGATTRPEGLSAEPTDNSAERGATVESRSPTARARARTARARTARALGQRGLGQRGLGQRGLGQRGLGQRGRWCAQYGYGLWRYGRRLRPCRRARSGGRGGGKPVAWPGRLRRRCADRDHPRMAEDRLAGGRVRDGRGRRTRRPPVRPGQGRR